MAVSRAPAAGAPRSAAARMPASLRSAAACAALLLPAALAEPALTSSSWGAAAGCDSALGCSLNGMCSAGRCVCDPPWTGASCGELKYKAPTPAGGKNAYNTSD